MHSLAAFGLTLLVEVPLYVAALTGLCRLAWRPAIVAALLANVMTHPVLWGALRAFTAEPWYPWLVLGAEAVVCGVEYLVVARVARRRTGPRPGAADRTLMATVVVGVNAASVLAGALVG